MNHDTALLRRYSEDGSPEAFAELVRRHTDLVYGAAMRRTGGDAHRSADVAQQVFTSLARHARKLAPETVLGAWLHTATRNAALTLMISEKRRREREIAATAFQDAHTVTGGDLAWETLRPLLDREIDGLPEPDRASLVLRFFERKPFAEIGRALRISEDAARMRTERALGKLSTALARHGITSSATALATAVSAQPLITAPVGLAATLAAQSLSLVGTGTIGASVATFMTAKIIIPAILIALAAFALGTFMGLNQTREPATVLTSPSPKLTQTVAGLRGENHRLNVQLENLTADIEQTKAVNAALVDRLATATRAAAAPSAVTGKSPNMGLERYEVQQAMLNNLRQIAAARDQFILEKGHPPEALRELVGRGRYIKTVRTVGGEDYSGLAMTSGGVLSVTTPDGITVTYDPSGATTSTIDIPPQVAHLKALEQRLQPVVNKAVASYVAANNGKGPPNEQALLPYFSTPQDGADFLEFVEAQKSGEGP
jgi:RNA polymerase sigma factor (sigma-70 family)